MFGQSISVMHNCDRSNYRAIHRSAPEMMRHCDRDQYDNAAMPKTTIQSRFAEALEESKLTQKQLAKLVGCGQSTIAALKKREGASSTFIPRIAEVLGVNALWLSDGKGPKRGPAEAKPEALRHIDAELLFACITATERWLAGGVRRMTPKQKIEMAAHLYELFPPGASDDEMQGFLARWLEFNKRIKPDDE